MKSSLASFATTAVFLCVTTSVSAAELDLPTDGWTSWDIPAVAGAPAWCCQKPGSPAETTICRLDDRQNGYISRDSETTDAVRVYARFADGKLQRLRALSASCTVQANSEIRKLSLSEQASVEWLSGLTGPDGRVDNRLRNDAMAALAVHRTSLANDVLAELARRGGQLEIRKNAVFWLALLRGSDGASLTRSLMFGDSDARMREHAAFALTQSRSPRVTDDLIRLATTDRDRKVRGQAWFWLSHMGSPQVETAITTALRSETDRHVREQAIFALSQLPEERATHALIGVVENKALAQEDRKKAIFWLAQANSDGALAYLDKVLQAAAR
jgi:HEAT repeat protein